jgi:hypothetical protein
MSKAHLIAPLLAKAADSSLSTAERSQASAYAKKLQDQYREQKASTPETNKKSESFPIDTSLDDNIFYTIDILYYAATHPDYNNLLVTPLQTWHCRKTSNAEGNNIWITKRPDLARAAKELMKALATEHYENLEAGKKEEAKKLADAEVARKKRSAEQGYERVDTYDYARNKSGGFVKSSKDTTSKKNYVILKIVCAALGFVLAMLTLFM